MRRGAAVASLAAAVLASAPAHAVIPSGNLLQNPGAEAGPGAANELEVVEVPGWEETPNLTAVQYGASSGFPDARVSSAIGGGSNFLAGGPENNGGISTALQTIDLSVAAPEIDAGGQFMTLSGFLGGLGGQDDQATASVVLTDSDGQATTGTQIVGPTASERGGQTGFLRRSESIAVPPGSRSAQVVLVSFRQSGTYNDGYYDNLSLAFGRDPGPPPDFKETATAAPVSGVVFVLRNGRFVPLQEGEEIRLGTTLDTTNGEVQLTTAANASGETQTGTFGGGRFRITQVGGANPVTDLSLKGGSFRTCRLQGEPRGRAQTAQRRTIRRLSGNARGRFRTRGRHSSATVRGTRWTMQDRCDGTLTRVQSGSVRVRDFAKRRTVTVRRGRSYLARPRRR